MHRVRGPVSKSDAVGVVLQSKWCLWPVLSSGVLVRLAVNISGPFSAASQSMSRSEVM